MEEEEDVMAKKLKQADFPRVLEVEHVISPEALSYQLELKCLKLMK